MGARKNKKRGQGKGKGDVKVVKDKTRATSEHLKDTHIKVLNTNSSSCKIWLVAFLGTAFGLHADQAIMT